jgi:hypothetical protein
MSKNIENPVECEVRALIRFLNAQNVRPIEIYRQLIAVSVEGVMNGSNMRKLCRMFNEGRTNVHDEERSGRPSLITEDLKNKINQHIRGNRRFTLDKVHENFPQIYLSVKTEIVSTYIIETFAFLKSQKVSLCF